MTVDVGKIFIDENGAGRLYIPKTIIQALEVSHKEQLRLQVNDGQLNARPLKEI